MKFCSPIGLRQEGVGVGFYGPKHQDSFYIRLEKYYTGFQAETFAIKMCAAQIIEAGRARLSGSVPTVKQL